MTIIVSNVYLEGTPVKVAFTFQDPTTLTYEDPTTITLNYSINGIAQTTLTYPSSNITRAAQGSFYVLFPTLTLSGLWQWSMYSTGVEGSAEGTFYVEPLNPQ